MSYAFGPLSEGNLQGRGGYQYYRKMLDVKNAPLYYVFVEEEHNGSSYGANEGGWHLPMGCSMNRLANPASRAFYDPPASYHIKVNLCIIWIKLSID